MTSEYGAQKFDTNETSCWFVFLIGCKFVFEKVGLFSQATGQVPLMKSCSATLIKRNARQEYLHGVRVIFVWP